MGRQFLQRKDERDDLFAMRVWMAMIPSMPEAEHWAATVWVVTQAKLRAKKEVENVEANIAKLDEAVRLAKEEEEKIAAAYAAREVHDE